MNWRDTLPYELIEGYVAGLRDRHNDKTYTTPVYVYLDEICVYIPVPKTLLPEYFDGLSLQTLQTFLPTVASIDMDASPPPDFPGVIGSVQFIRVTFRCLWEVLAPSVPEPKWMLQAYNKHLSRQYRDDQKSKGRLSSLLLEGPESRNVENESGSKET